MFEKSYLEELDQMIQKLKTVQNSSDTYILLVHPDIKDLIEKEVQLPDHIQLKVSPIIEKTKAYFLIKR